MKVVSSTEDNGRITSVTIEEYSSHQDQYTLYVFSNSGSGKVVSGTQHTNLVEENGKYTPSPNSKKNLLGNNYFVSSSYANYFMQKLIRDPGHYVEEFKRDALGTLK